MADEKAKKGNKNLIIGIVAALVVVVVVVVAIVLATRGSKLDDSFFVSDGSKYVVTMMGDDESLGEDSPVKTHAVYFYSGDKVTDMKYYYEFTSEDAAKKMFDIYKELETDGSGTYELNGKYVILTVDASQYEGMTADDAKQQVEFMKMLENMDDEDYSDDADESDDVDEFDDLEEIDETDLEETEDSEE